MTTYYSEPGVINAIDPLVEISGMFYGLTANDSSVATAQRNSLVMLGLISIAQAICDQSGSPPKNYGATILIPGHSTAPQIGGTDSGSVYYFAKQDGTENTVAIPIHCNWPIRFLGTGSTKLIMIGDDNGELGDFFTLLTNDTDLGDNTGGMTFEDLWIGFEGAASGDPYAAIHTLPIPMSPKNGGAQGVRVVRCFFNDCPVAIWFEESLISHVLQTTIQYSSIYGTGIRIGDAGAEYDNSAGKEIYVNDCLLHVLKDAPRGGTAIEFLGCEHAFVSTTRIDSFQYGILITPGDIGVNVIRVTFTAVAVESGTDESGNLGFACKIQPQGSGQAVSQIVFNGCAFELGENAAPIYPGGPGVLVDASLGPIDTVRFNGCYSARWPGPGLSVIGPVTNVEVNGGMFSSNYLPMYTEYAYGIYLGPGSGEEPQSPNGVRIIGASCVGQNPYIKLNSTGADYQQAVGIYVDAGVSDVVISGCDLRNNSAEGIYINGGATNVVIDGCDIRNDTSTNGIVVNSSTTVVSNIFIRNCDLTGYSAYNVAIDVLTGAGVGALTLEITNCAGYNDRNVKLSTTPPATGSTFDAQSHAYYGPIVFYVWGGTGVSLGIGTNTGIVTPIALASGSFALTPTQVAVLTYTALPNFLMVGV